MRYCGSQGIAHSSFLKWSKFDQDKAISWMLADASKCQRCGTVPDEWLDDEGIYIDPPPYVATSVLCGGCEALGDKRKEIPESDGHKYHVFLKPA